MAKKKKILPLLEGVHIESLAAEGKALAHIDGQVLFVPFAMPGDVCDVQVVKKKRNFLEGRIVQILEPAPGRKEPVCSHHGHCGGCKWQHVPYALQLEAKDQHVRDAMTRLGKIAVGEYLPILGSARTERYRNKLEFTFSHKRWLLPGEITEEQFASHVDEEGNRLPYAEPGLGFHIPGMFDKVLDIDTCYLGHELLDRVRLFIRNYCLERAEEYPFFDLRSQSGLMRTLMMRTTSIGESMVVMVFYQDEPELRTRLLDAVHTEFPEITALLYVINSKANDTITDQEILVHSGRAYIEEEMEGLRFRIGPKSFYQTNSEQAYELYKVARDFAGLTGDEHVYDLYTGTGTIANFVARSARSVVGIEYVPEAIADAKLNSEVNGISNTLFYAGDMKDILTDEFIAQHGQPDVIITDPPRAGMHENVVATILRASPKRIVYVSCNPATQARDLALLTESGVYTVSKSRAVDMFPHTHHIENVVLLEK